MDRKKRGGIIVDISNHSDYNILHHAAIDFPLGVTVGDFQQMNVMLQLQYMRSYIDSGAVSLFLCDSYIQDLNALWDDYQNYHYTQQDAFSETLNPDWCKRKQAHESVVFSVRYNVNGSPEDMLKRLPPYGNQLFKINSVLVCQFQTVKVY